MAKIRAYATRENTGAVAGHTGSMPTHQPNDLLLWIVSKDDATGGTLTTPSDWTKGNETAYGASGANTLRAAWYWKIASSSNDDEPRVNNTDPDEYYSIMLSIEGVNTSSPINTSSATTDNTNPKTTAALTTTSGSCLIIFSCAVDGATSANNYPESSTMHLLAQDAGTVTLGAAWTFQQNSGSVPACNFVTNTITGDEAVLHAIAINDSGSTIPAYVDRQRAPARLLNPFNGITLPLSGAFPTSLSLASIGSMATVFDAAATTADFGLNPYDSAASSTPLQTAAGSTSGFQFNFLTSVNVATGTVLFSIRGANPRDYIDLGIYNTAERGLAFTLADASNNYVSYIYGARNAVPDFRDLMLACIQPSYSGSAYARSVTPPDLTAINKVLFTSTCPRGAITYYVNQLVALDTLTIAGGTQQSPVTISDVITCGQSYPLPYMQKQGSAGCLSYIAIQLGGGEQIYANIEGSAIQFPQVAGTGTNQANYHATTSSIGISYYGQAGDTINHINSVIASTSPFYWEIHPSASNAATYDFSGLTIVGAKPLTLRNVTTFNGMTFSNCGQIDARGCSINDCAISMPQTGSTSCMLLSISSSIQNCTFEGRNTDYAIELPTSGTYNLSNVSYTGFTNDIRISAITGSVVINILNGGETPTYTTAGALVTVNNNVSVTLTGLRDNTEVRVYSAGTTTELAGIENAIDGTSNDRSFSFSLAATTSVDIRIHNITYETISILSYEIPASNASIPIQQRFDRNYSNN